MTTPSGKVALRPFVLITAGAVVALAAYSILPRGGELTPMDFIADSAAVLELCNPLNSGPPPAALGRAPVSMVGALSRPGTGGGRLAGRFDLATISGRPVAAADLAVVDGRLMRLTVSTKGAGAPAGLTGVLPDPTRPGRWRFEFEPSGPGPYLLTAAFTPKVTGNELSVSALLSPGG